MSQQVPALREVLRIKDLIELGFGGRSSIHRKISKGLFPGPDFNDGRPGWFRDTLRDRLTKRAA